MNDNRFDPGEASQELATGEVAYDDLENRVWRAMNAAIAARTHGDLAERDIEQILRAMRETHESMRSVYSMANRVEKKTKQPTGRWLDAVLLARPQYDAAFVALLLAHDYQEWGPKYHKAGWAANAVRSFYNLRRFQKTPAWQKEKTRIIRHLKEHARQLGIGVREWIATTAEVRGKPMRYRAASRDTVCSLPTPGQIVQRSILQSGPHARLSQLLWQQWKILCDPAHIGIGILINKAVIRGEPSDGELDRTRERFIEGEVVDRSIKPSFVAVMTVVTLLAERHKDNADMLGLVDQAWDVLEKGTIEGGVVWDGWAGAALGVLGTA